MKNTIVTNIEHMTIYGIDVIFDKLMGEYRCYIGGRKYQAVHKDDIAYKIMCLQSHPTI